MKPVKAAIALSCLTASCAASAELYNCVADGFAVQLDIPCAESPLTDTYKLNQKLSMDAAAQQAIFDQQRADEARAQIDSVTASLKIDPDAGAAGWQLASDDAASQAIMAAELALMRKLKDPSSYERISHTGVWEKQSRRFVGIEYRAKNSFGAYSVGGHALVVDWNGDVFLDRPWNGEHITTVFSDRFSPPQDIRLALLPQELREPAGKSALQYAQNSVGFTRISANQAVSAKGISKTFVELAFQATGARPLTDLQATIYFINAKGTEILDQREVILVSGSDTPLQSDGLYLGSKDFVFGDISERWQNGNQVRAKITSARFADGAEE